MMRGMLSQLLQAKLGAAVQAQTQMGIGPVPKDDADELLLRLAQLPHDRVRGLIVIAALDIDSPVRGQGLDIQTFALGTPATLDPLLDLGCSQLDEKLQHPDQLVPGEVCRDCGCPHVNFANEENFGGSPMGRGTELHQLLESLMGLRRTF